MGLTTGLFWSKLVHMKDRPFVPALLTEMRLRRLMNLRELSDATGVSYNYVKLLERGVHEPSDLYIAKLAHGLQCSVNDLTRPTIENARAAA